AEPPQAEQDSRVPDPHEDQIRPGGAFAPSRQGTQAGVREARVPRVIAARLPLLLTSSMKSALARRPAAGRMQSRCRFPVNTACANTPNLSKCTAADGDTFRRF